MHEYLGACAQGAFLRDAAATVGAKAMGTAGTCETSYASVHALRPIDFGHLTGLNRADSARNVLV